MSDELKCFHCGASVTAEKYVYDGDPPFEESTKTHWEIYHCCPVFEQALVVVGSTKQECKTKWSRGAPSPSHDELRAAEINERLRLLEERNRRLKAMMPLFQEARDALCAITETQRRLHNISPTLAKRMDQIGEADAWRSFDEANPVALSKEKNDEE